MPDTTKTFDHYLKTDAGNLRISGTAQGVQGIYFVDELGPHKKAPKALEQAAKQLKEYFNHQRKTFDFPLDLQGTDFQKKVWAELLRIPYGKTTTYQKLADAIGQPKAVRAVGLANGKNKVSIVVPCHRVIGSDGSLTGYAGGLERKRWLLEWEDALPQKSLF